MSDDKPLDPPAFPTPYPATRQDHAYTADGMTLRDYFAAKAMMGMLANDQRDTPLIVKAAYVLADAMLAERQKA